MSKQTIFFEKYRSEAIRTQNLFGVPASITLSQAALESGWGLSGLTVNANNFFGIKADKSWTGSTYNAMTKEVFSGNTVTINSNFRKYKTAADSFDDHAKFLMKFSRYKILFENLDPFQWADKISKAGYATDPLYTSKLTAMIKQYDLTKYDAEAAQKKNT